MKNFSINDMNFQYILEKCEKENLNTINEIFENKNIKDLKEKSLRAYKSKIEENCSKIYSDLKYFCKDSKIYNNYEIDCEALPGKEREVQILKKKWDSCVDKYNHLEKEKNNSISSISYINSSFFIDCVNDCKKKRSNEQQICVGDCFNYYKMNSSISIRLLEDVLLKHLNNIKNI